MKKFKICLAIAIAAIAVVGVGVYSHQTSHEKLLAQEQGTMFLENIEALTQAPESSVRNTGPGEVVRKGLFRGKVKVCHCENAYPCTQMVL